MAEATEAQHRALRRIGMFCFASWAVFVAAAMRLAALSGSPENQLRFGVAVIGTAVALFAVARAGTWPRTLYLLSIGYLAYFAAGSGWQELWQVATVPADGVAETLAVTLELAARVVEKDFASGRYAPALARAYDLALMPLAQLVVVVYLARTLLRKS
jgi:hypothetical protein